MQLRNIKEALCPHPNGQMQLLTIVPERGERYIHGRPVSRVWTLGGKAWPRTADPVSHATEMPSTGARRQHATSTGFTHQQPPPTQLAPQPTLRKAYTGQLLGSRAYMPPRKVYHSPLSYTSTMEAGISPGYSVSSGQAHSPSVILQTPWYCKPAAYCPTGAGHRHNQSGLSHDKNQIETGVKTGQKNTCVEWDPNQQDCPESCSVIAAPGVLRTFPSVPTGHSYLSDAVCNNRLYR
ncbi:hypothetical protein Bbelb_233190 [Branchiostoma belcheri]|nr:hypothetical protein Bbelb_233190 [Branchiostoma belcheri]